MARRINECQVRTSRSELWASTTTTSPIKGVLIKRSKSFGTNNNNNSNKSGHGHRNYFSTNALLLSEPENDRFVLSLEGLSWNNMSLIKQALDAHHCSSLSTTDQLQVVRILTNKVLDKSGHARLVALVCLEMHYKLIGSCSPHVGGRVFLESLYHCLQEYFNERDVLRFTTGGARRWTAYITFLVSIYTSLCRDFEQHSHIVAEYIRQHVLNDNWRPLATTAANNAAAAAAAALETGMQSEKHRRQFANLLLDTFQVILSNPSSTPAEIECMQCALHKCGEYLEEDNAGRVQSLLASVRNTLLDPGCQLVNASSGGNSSIAKDLLEIIELAASGWTLTETQQIYYFPYTKVD